MRRWRTISLVLIPLAFAVPSAAENLYPSGHFDSPLDDDDWQTSILLTSLSHLPDTDADACVASGAELASNGAPTDILPITGEFFVCMTGLTGSQPYRFGAELYFPGGQTVAGTAGVNLRWSQAANCSAPSAPASTPLVDSTSSALWIPVEAVATSPSGTLSARIAVALTKTTLLSAETLSLQFDKVFVQPATDVFLDDFEIGESCRWDQTVS